MAVFCCPSCGRPTTIPLASPGAFRCRACNASGPTPPELATRLQEAGQWIHAVQFRGRNAAAAHRRAVDQLRKILVLYWLLSVVPLLMAGCCAWAGLDLAFRGKSVDLSQLFTWLPPIVVLVPTLALTSVYLVRRRRALEGKHAAIPPLPGHNPECRICGAELPPPTGDPYVDCRFCDADNLVDPDVLRRIGHDKLVSIDEYQRHIAAEARAASSEAKISVAGTLGFALALPFLSMLVAAIGSVALSSIVGNSHAPGLELGQIDAGGTRCLARVHELTDGRLELYTKLPDGKLVQPVVSRRDANVVREAQLAGRAATVHECETKKTRPVTIVRVDESLGDPRIVIKESDGSDSVWYPGVACGLCLR
jgi:hypothetical protein